MTIQLPIILWTIICFVLLMLILRNLLFRPLIACMDKRNQRIAAAKEKQRQDAEDVRLAIAAQEQDVEEKNAEARAEAERKVAEERIRAEQALADRTKAEQSVSDAYAAELEAEKKALCEKTEQEARRLSEIYASGFVS